MSKPVLFVSFRPLSRAENICAIYNAYPGEKVHILSTDPRYRQEVTSGKYDVMVTDDFPSCTPGKCIVIWHGIHGGKTIGLDQPGHPYFSEETAKMISYIISAGTGMIPIWSRCTGVPYSHILPLGMPRTDHYVAFPNDSSLYDKHLYLFVPTFRDKNDTPFPDIDWQYLNDQLTDDEFIVIKAHPWQSDTGINQVTAAIKDGMYKHIGILSPATESFSWMFIADAIVTDYSSIMFDAYLLNKQVVLFEKTPGYSETRGMCFHYPEDYCSYYATTEEDLLKKIRYRIKHPHITPNEERIRDIVADRCDGHACERLIQLINDINKE